MLYGKCNKINVKVIIKISVGKCLKVIIKPAFRYDPVTWSTSAHHYHCSSDVYSIQQCKVQLGSCHMHATDGTSLALLTTMPVYLSKHP